MDLFLAISMIQVIGMGFVFYQKGHVEAKYFLIPWGIFMASVFIWSLGQLDFIEDSYLIANTPVVGNMLEMTFMSLALAQRIKSMQVSQLESELKAKEGEKMRKLLRVVCHDIANPLAVAEGYNTMLGKKIKDEPKIKKYNNRVSKAISMIDEILNDVRKLEGLDSGKSHIEIEEVNLSEVLEDLHFLFDSRLIAKKLKLEELIEYKLEDYAILANKTALVHDVLANIISNAIKFSREGGIIEFKASIVSEIIVLSIKDSGIGMPEEIMKDIFDPTAQTSRTGTGGESGTGFGLPLVKNYVKLFHGTVDVQSRSQEEFPESSGTVFILNIPIVRKSSKISSVV